MKLLCALLASIALCGCASQPITLAQAKLVPASRTVSEPVGVVSGLAQGGELIVVRDPIRGGKGPLLQLSINGKLVASMEPSERYQVYLADGEYVVSIVPNPNPLSQFTSASTTVMVKAGKTYELRAGYAPFSYFLQRVP